MSKDQLLSLDICIYIYVLYYFMLNVYIHIIYILCCIDIIYILCCIDSDYIVYYIYIKICIYNDYLESSLLDVWQGLLSQVMLHK
jgi:hypothetical protein